MQVSVRELKNNLSRYLKEVSQGKVIKITRHRHLIAKLCPIAENKTGLEGLIENMVTSMISMSRGKT